MGGTVGVTIIREDGEVIKMARKTGSYSSLFLSKEFNSGDYNSAINDYIAPFNEMKEDYNSGEPFKFPMSPIYGRFNQTSPIDYGLVVIDFKHKKIHSYQDYDVVGSILPSILSKYYILSPHEDLQLENLFNNNQINVFHRSDEADYSNVSNFNKLGSFKQQFGDIDYQSFKQQDNINIFQYFKQLLQPLFDKTNNIDEHSLIFFPSELEKFQYFSYTSSPKQVIDYVSNLIADGLSFNEDEIDSWTQALENELEIYEPDADLDTLNDDEITQLIDNEKSKFRNQLKDNFKKTRKKTLKQP